MEYIKLFQDIKKEDISIVGGKGANLGEMLNAGFPVPDGFCITAYAYDEYIKRNNLQQLDSNDKELYSQIAIGSLWDELQDEIIKCYTELGKNVRVAVRSSATAEDLPEASFAGQQETYLNVVGIEQLFKAVKKCFASLFSTRAIAYRKQADFDDVKVSLAVVVQEMVESEISGVLFTADPISQEKGRMMLNASWGLGEAIVSGKVTPDIYIYNKNKNSIIDKNMGSKDIFICYGNTGIIEKQTLKEQKCCFCLAEEQALEVFKMGINVEHHYGTPQDIEWAISKGKVYLLQSRPITTLKENEQKRVELSASQKAVLNNWIEHCPIPLYPLDVEPCEIVDKAKAKVFHELGISIGGELSMDENGVLSLSTGKMHISPRILKIPFILKQFTNYAVNSENTESEFIKIIAKLNEIEKLDVTHLSVDDLIKQLNILMDLSDIIAYVRFRYNIFPGIVISKLVYPSLKKIDKNINEFDLLSNLAYKTWELNIELKELVIFIQNTPPLENVVDTLNYMDPDSIMSVLNDYPAFSEKLQGFINNFGWKSTSSYCAFGSASWNEDMTSLFSLIKVLLYSKNTAIDTNKYQSIITKVDKRFRVKKARRLQKKIEEIRGYHIYREESLYLIEMCYGLARRMVFEINDRFPDLFKKPKDILFLTLKEVYSLPDSSQNYKELLAVRQKSRLQNEKLWNSFSIGSKVTDKENTLAGIRGNSGICRGKVRKILTLQEFSKMQPGDILVCRYTDPAWTPLFVLASAVVSDTGGPLSHSAIVAREYNIPAVLGCGNATEILNDGQEIIVNGNEGIVQILKTLNIV